MNTRKSSLVYLSKIGKTLKPFYDFETKVYDFQNEGKMVKISFLIVGIIFIVWGILVGSVGFLYLLQNRLQLKMYYLDMWQLFYRYYFFVG